MAYMEAEGLTRYFLRRKKVREAGPRRWFARERETVKALDHVSFQVEAGELVGLIGPNGAGKSTTVKLLTGILTPTEGACRVAGRVPWQERKQHVRELGVVFGQRTQLWWDVPIADSFDLLREIMTGRAMTGRSGSSRSAPPWSWNRCCARPSGS